MFEGISLIKASHIIVILSYIMSSYYGCNVVCRSVIKRSPTAMVSNTHVVLLLPCSLVEFHPDISLLQLFSSASDCGIRMWDLRSSQCLCVLQSHYSPVTSLAFTPDGASMVRYCNNQSTVSSMHLFLHQHLLERVLQ
jgi:WD40 repeat protein